MCGLFAAVICVSAFITIPLFFTPVSFTLQVMAVSAAAAVLGGKRGALSVIIYVLLGAFGLPVFSGMKGGIGVLAGATGGYIWGFIPEAFVSGCIIEKFCKGNGSFTKNLAVSIAALIVGLAIVYVCGTFQIMYVASMDIKTALGAAVLPFIPFDLVKIVIAAVISISIKKAVNLYENI